MKRYIGVDTTLKERLMFFLFSIVNEEIIDGRVKELIEEARIENKQKEFEIKTVEEYKVDEQVKPIKQEIKMPVMTFFETNTKPIKSRIK